MQQVRRRAEHIALVGARGDVVADLAQVLDPGPDGGPAHLELLRELGAGDAGRPGLPHRGEDPAVRAGRLRGLGGGQAGGPHRRRGGDDGVRSGRDAASSRFRGGSIGAVSVHTKSNPRSTAFAEWVTAPTEM